MNVRDVIRVPLRRRGCHLKSAALEREEKHPEFNMRDIHHTSSKSLSRLTILARVPNNAWGNMRHNSVPLSGTRR